MTLIFVKEFMLLENIKAWAKSLGFQQVGITDIDLSAYETRFNNWIKNKFHGDMHYMVKHGSKRTRPASLISNTIRIISVRMNYLPPNTKRFSVLMNPRQAYISRYALGKDYHKLIRKRLALLANKISHAIGPFGYRAFCDSAPVLEKPIAEKAGLGFIGKHTNLIHPKAGSWFFLGEIYTDLPLPVDPPITQSHCGTCTTCIDICPTNAIIGPYQLDARRCISYLTIEWRGVIPEVFRPLIGNRIYGCDDCQLFCPWNKFAAYTNEREFYPRYDLDSASLLTLFAWSEEDFKERTRHSAIKRIGYECWLRNIAVALGNAPFDTAIVEALQKRKEGASSLVKEHIEWALKQLLAPKKNKPKK